MSNVDDYKESIINELSENGFDYKVLSENEIALRVSGDNVKEVILIFCIYNESTSSSILGRIEQLGDDVPGMYLANMLNSQNRLIKFFIDDEGYLVAGTDFILEREAEFKEFAGNVVVNKFIGMMLHTIDRNYPVIMKFKSDFNL